MNVNERIELLAAAGSLIESDLKQNRLNDLILKAENENPWFIKSFVAEALQNLVSNFLNKQKLIDWTKGYDFGDDLKSVGIVAAGNIPLVGVHDLLSVFVSGNKTLLKLSAKDAALMNYVISSMAEIDPSISQRIEIVDRLKGFDAVIATGSDNTNRYFEQYFGKYPNLLRKNRTSVAVVENSITDKQLKLLVKDIYNYFGLGCRSISKVYLEDGFEKERLFSACSEFEWLQNHYKFQNNYTYQKSIYLVNKVSHFDTGFSIFREETALHSPIAVTFFEKFDSWADLNFQIEALQEQIQIVISDTDRNMQLPVIQYGNSQNTGLFDYADGKNTLDFLAKL
jgi:hypothetical protein